MSTNEAEIRELLRNITPGTWEMYRYSTGGGRIFVEGIGNHYEGRSLVADMEPVRRDPEHGATAYHEGDREFLFAAPTIVADLLAEVDRLRTELAAVLAIHFRAICCDPCAAPACDGWCNECTQDWPCDTARALGVS